MAQSPLNSRRDDTTDSNIRDWTLKARMISRENTRSRRFSSSYITSFREDSRSFRSNITISSTVSSPGNNLKEEIDPSTYSFTSALRALQARTVNTWECLSPEGFALNSKWNEAEKYICNPLSGEVPMECLSAKTLSGRSFRNLTGRITMSAPLIYPSHSRFIQTNPCFSPFDRDYAKTLNTIKENKVGNMLTRDVGVQSTSPDLTSASDTPASSSSQMGGISSKLAPATGGTSSNSTPNSISKEEEGKVKETDEEKQEQESKGEEEEQEENMEREGKKQPNNKKMWKCRVGCLPLKSLRRRQEREYKHIPRKQKKNIFPFPC